MNVKVIQNTLWGERQGFITLDALPFAQAYKSGQMCMLSVSGNKCTNPLLKRPFAPYSVNTNNGEVAFLYNVVGRGTELLMQATEGDYLDLTEPHGKPFTLKPSGTAVALVAGGVGIAPINTLADTLKQRGCDVTIYYGGRSKNLLYPPILSKDFNWRICTDDGSVGFKGFVSQSLEADLNAGAGYSFCYTCGPMLMMKSITDLCIKHNIGVEVSLEETMACGIGVCSGCMVTIHDKGKNSLKRCCTEGPVFNGSTVIWDKTS